MNEESEDEKDIKEHEREEGNKKSNFGEDKENLLQPKSNIPIFNKVALKEEYLNRLF
jgi:hypothetical protein